MIVNSLVFVGNIYGNIRSENDTNMKRNMSRVNGVDQ
jgi:hypothetical protein